MSMSGLTWIEVKTSGRSPSPRHGHQMSCMMAADKNASLYVYGGIDELGGASNSMFRLNKLDLVRLDGEATLGPNGQPVMPVWTEIEHELQPNVCRIGIFYGDSLGSFQA
eukprot:1115252-Pyramimonas_sp.AAC.1